MENVWDELKKIEAQAEQIKTEAQKKAKELADIAKQESDSLVSNGNAYAEKEAQKIYDYAVSEANCNSEKLLKANAQTREKLKMKAAKRMEKASLAIVNAVLGETKP